MARCRFTRQCAFPAALIDPAWLGREHRARVRQLESCLHNLQVHPDEVQSAFGSVLGQGFDLAFDSAGNLFATDNGGGSGNQTIWKFTPDGTRSVFVGPSGLPPGEGPIGLTFDRFGNLFVSTESGLFSSPNDVILEFTPDGVGSTFATDLDRYPRRLAFDHAGNLFVSEVGVNPNPGGNILKFTPNGVETVSAVVPGGNNNGPEWLAFQLPPHPPRRRRHHHHHHHLTQRHRRTRPRALTECITICRNRARSDTPRSSFTARGNRPCAGVSRSRCQRHRLVRSLFAKQNHRGQMKSRS